MPLEPYARGATWWVRGRVDLDGVPVTGYYRRSTGASSQGGARDWIAAETARARRRHVTGEPQDALTFSAAVLLYPAKPAEAKRLIRLIEARPDFGARHVPGITPKEIRALGPDLMPAASTDTWRREIVAPIRAVINNAHEEGLCPPIRVRGYSPAERIEQDRVRGRQSRAERIPGDRTWLAAFDAHADVYNAALAAFMFETAARIGQAVQLRPRDLDLMQSRVWMPASKGHPAQWVAISTALTVRLANLPAKRPHNRATGARGAPRVFGYASPTSMHDRWRTICKAAGILYLPPHQAGRHGFYTELRVRQGVDPITAAKAGRWSDPALPDRIYAHSDVDERDLRERIGTSSVHAGPTQSANPRKARG